MPLIRRIIMGISFALFFLFLGIFIPSLVTMYFEYIKEPNTFILIRDHPYSIPGIVMIIILLIAGYFAYKEHQGKKNKRRKGKVPKNELELIKERLDSIERRIPPQ